jgi:hypothetical protein
MKTLTKEEILDSIIRDWATPVTRMDAMQAMDSWHDQQSRLLREALEKIRDTKEFEFMSTAVVLSMKAIAKEALEK